MKKANLLTTAIAVATFAIAPAFAAQDMEKCTVVGPNQIKEGQNDCSTKNNSCAGTAKKGDPEAWIMVPAGKCKDINAGNFEGVPDDIKAKIESAK